MRQYIYIIKRVNYKLEHICQYIYNQVYKNTSYNDNLFS